MVPNRISIWGRPDGILRRSRKCQTPNATFFLINLGLEILLVQSFSVGNYLSSAMFSTSKQCSKPLLVDYYMGYTTLNYVILCYTTSMLSYPIVIEDYQNPWPAKSHKIVWVHPHSILMIQCVMGIFPTNINIYIVVPFNMDDPLKKNMWVCSNSNHPQFYHFYRWHKHASTINP